MLYGTYLAFDFGLSRTGVATGNSVTRSAEPRGILFAQTNAERWAAIEALVEHWEPVAFVVGVPRHAQDRKSTRLNSSHTTRSRMPSSA